MLIGRSGTEFEAHSTKYGDMILTCWWVNLDSVISLNQPLEEWDSVVNAHRSMNFGVNLNINFDVSCFHGDIE